MKSIKFLLFSLVFITIQAENCSLENFYDNPQMQPLATPFNVSEYFTTIELPYEIGARCLDGTNYKFAYHPGSGEDKSKFMLFWQGSSFCGDDGNDFLDSCFRRISSKLGTSNATYYGANGEVLDYNTTFGWFSSLEEFNPLFANWSKVMIFSCDGSLYQGSLEDPILYNGSYMYFRGFNNTMGTIEYLKENYGLFKATEIILSGGSSGASSALFWISYLQDYFPKNIKLYGILDAGFFLDTYSPTNGCFLYRYMLENLANITDSKNSLIFSKCRYAQTMIWKCFLYEYIYDDINIPLFIINSENDYKQLTNLNQLSCIDNGGPENCNQTERNQIILIREQFLKITMKIKKMKPNWGFWLRTCFEHTYYFTWGWYGEEMNVFSAENGENSNIRDALYSWYKEINMNLHRVISYIDIIDWLHNPLCHYGDYIYNGK